MTKPDLLAGPVCRHHVADLNIPISDDHPINQKFHQRPPLLKGGLGQPPLHSLAKRPNGAGQSGKFLLPVNLCLELPLLLSEPLLTFFKVTSAPPTLVQTHHASEIGLGQALELLPEARLATPEPVLARL